MLKQTLSPLYFLFGSKVIPHPDKRAKGGEDAFFASERALAVADGVSTWSEDGVDPALYSRALMKHVGQQLATNPLEPKPVLVEAAAAVKDIIGTSTACVLILDDQENCIRSANLGDSVYMVFRPPSDETGQSSIIHVAKCQQHEFNYPFQCGTKGDDPNEAEEFKMDVQVDDVIVLATDGLWDNMYPEELQEIYETWRIHLSQGPDASVRYLAMMIAQQAYQDSLDRNRMPPFRREALNQRIHLAQTIGGKLDDITVVVGRVVNSDFVDSLQARARREAENVKKEEKEAEEKKEMEERRKEKEQEEQEEVDASERARLDSEKRENEEDAEEGVDGSEEPRNHKQEKRETKPKHEQEG